MLEYIIATKLDYKCNVLKSQTPNTAIGAFFCPALNANIKLSCP